MLVKAISLCVLFLAASRGDCQSLGEPYSPVVTLDALSPEEWRRIDTAVDRGLAWLATQQQADGSFPTAIGGQPAVTSLAAMAFMSRGHRPGYGPYGETLNRAIDFALRCQRAEGCFVLDATNMPTQQWNRGAHTGMYNHAITGLMLGEAYGQVDEEREARVGAALERALAFARTSQLRPGKKPLDAHGWRYYRPLNSPTKGEADLSVTGWFVMFYRSARNAEFQVPEEHVRDAIRFVKNCYDEREGGFVYGPYPSDRNRGVGRGMTGAGLLCLAVSGNRDPKVAAASGRWILDHPLNQFDKGVGGHDRFLYGAYYCSQAMFLLGGEYWRRFYPTMSKTVLSGQTPSGAWRHEGADRQFGQSYSTSLAILSLTPPYQLLPIYQR